MVGLCVISCPCSNYTSAAALKKMIWTITVGMYLCSVVLDVEIDIRYFRPKTQTLSYKHSLQRL